MFCLEKIKKDALVMRTNALEHAERKTSVFKESLQRASFKPKNVSTVECKFRKSRSLHALRTARLLGSVSVVSRTMGRVPGDHRPSNAAREFGRDRTGEVGLQSTKIGFSNR